MIPDFEHKLAVYNKFFNQDGYNVKTLEEGAKYIYLGLSQDQKEKLADVFFNRIEKAFEELHRDYAQMLLMKLTPVFLARDKDL